MTLDQILQAIVAMLPTLFRLAPELAAGIQAVIHGQRPDLVGPPPPSAADQIAAEDEGIIASHFPDTIPAPPPAVAP
jgi:hypothetical protein